MALRLTRDDCYEQRVIRQYSPQGVDMIDWKKMVPPYLSHKVRAGMTVEEAQIELEERRAKGMSFGDIMCLEGAMSREDRINAVDEFRRLHPPATLTTQ
jgi:hypothetical protein